MNGLISRLIYPGASRSVDVGQVERTLEPGEELVWQETTRDERIGLIIRPPAEKQRWIVFFYGNGMTVAGTRAVRQWLGSAGYGVACVEYAGFGVSSGSPSEYGCYRSADAAITYLQPAGPFPLARRPHPARHRAFPRRPRPHQPRGEQPQRGHRLGVQSHVENRPSAAATASAATGSRAG